MTRPREAPKFVPAPGIAGGIDDFIAFLEQCYCNCYSELCCKKLK